MPRRPRVTAAQVIRVLKRIGFQLVRQSGSHQVYQNAAGQRASVPFHAGSILKPKTLASILEDADLTFEEFGRLLRG